MIDLFAVQTEELNPTSHKKASEWTDTDLKERITVVIRDTADPKIERISIRIGGTTPVKLFNNKGSRTINKGSLTESEIYEQVKALDKGKLMPILRNAHKDLLASLHKSKLAKAAKIAKAKRLKREEHTFLAIQKQEEQLKMEMNLAKLKRDQNKVNTSIASK